MPLAQFTYNNTIHVFSKYTPFFASYGQHPKLDNFYIENIISNLAPKDFTTQLFQLYQEIKLHMQKAQLTYKTNANEQRKEPSSFKFGDQTWLI